MRDDSRNSQPKFFTCSIHLTHFPFQWGIGPECYHYQDEAVEKIFTVSVTRSTTCRSPGCVTATCWSTSAGYDRL